MTSLRNTSAMFGALALLAATAVLPAGAEVTRPGFHQDEEARAVFLEFAAMYSGLGTLHEKATRRIETESQFESLQHRGGSHGYPDYELWFQAPNLIRIEGEGELLVSDGERIVAPALDQGFYAERPAEKRFRMRDEIASVMGRASMLPSSSLWLFANNDKDRLGVFEDCQFRGSGADVLDGKACVWVDLAWVHEDACGNSSSVSGFVWFEAESGRLRRIEIDMTDLMNASILESQRDMSFLGKDYDPATDGDPYDRYVSITEIEVSETPERFDDWVFEARVPEGLTRELSMVNGLKAAEERREALMNPGDQLKRMLGKPAPKIDGADVSGERFNLAELGGAPVVMALNPIYEPMPVERLEELERFAQRHADRGVVVATTQSGMHRYMPEVEAVDGDDQLARFVGREDRRLVVLEPDALVALMSRNFTLSNGLILLIDGDGVVQSAHPIERGEDLPLDELNSEIATVLAGGTVYDIDEIEALRASDLAAMDELERAAPMIPKGDLNTERFGSRRSSSGASDYAEFRFAEDLNGDGYRELLSRPGIGGYVLEDGRTRAQRVLRFEGLGDDVSKQVIGVNTGGDNSGFIVLSTSMPGEPKATTIGVYDVEGKARWRRTLQRDLSDEPSPAGASWGPPNVQLGDLDGDRVKEIVVWIRDPIAPDPESRKGGMPTGGRLLVLSDSGELLASKSFENMFEVRLVESGGRGTPGRIVLQGIGESIEATFH